jgi:hypothetical protein
MVRLLREHVQHSHQVNIAEPNPFAIAIFRFDFREL